jgi:hypothetical protein
MKSFFWLEEVFLKILLLISFFAWRFSRRTFLACMWMSRWICQWGWAKEVYLDFHKSVDNLSKWRQGPTNWTTTRERIRTVRWLQQQLPHPHLPDYLPTYPFRHCDMLAGVVLRKEEKREYGLSPSKINDSHQQ